MNLALKSAILALLVTLIVLGIQVGYSLHAVEATFDQVGAEFHILTVYTIQSEKATSDSLVAAGDAIREGAKNLAGDSQDPGAIASALYGAVGQIHLAVAGTDTKNGILDATDQVTTGMKLALLGYKDTRGIEHRGIMGVTNSASLALDQVGQVTSQVSDFMPQFESRYLAITGEASKTLDATRRTMNSVEKATPSFLNEYDALLTQTAGIAADVHTYTYHFTHQGVAGKAWDVFKLGVYGAARAF